MSGSGVAPPGGGGAAGPTTWTRAAVLRALSERYLLNRAVERSGFRRLALASAAFVAYRFVKAKLFDQPVASAGGGGGARGRA